MYLRVYNYVYTAITRVRHIVTVASKRELLIPKHDPHVSTRERRYVERSITFVTLC